MTLTVNFNTTEKAVHFSKRLVHSELFFFSSQDRRTVNNRTYYFLLFLYHVSLEPAGILDFPARYVNIYYRQTNLLNFTKQRVKLEFTKPFHQTL